MVKARPNRLRAQLVGGEAGVEILGEVGVMQTGFVVARIDAEYIGNPVAEKQPVAAGGAARNNTSSGAIFITAQRRGAALTRIENEVEIHSKLQRMCALGPREVVGHLVAPFKSQGRDGA